MGLQTRDLDEVNAEARSLVRIDTPETEAKFLKRVREKAEKMASEIVNKALIQAREIRLKARDEGRKEGMTLAMEEIQAKKEELSINAGKIFSGIEKEKQKIWDHYRQDIVFVLKTSIDRILGIEVSQNRVGIMESLLDQSLELAENRNELTLTVCREDEKMIRELLEKAREKYPHVGTCRIKSSSKIKKGGLILENGNGVVDNTLDSRYEQIREIVQQVSLTEEDS